MNPEDFAKLSMFDKAQYKARMECRQPRYFCSQCGTPISADEARLHAGFITQHEGYVSVAMQVPVHCAAHRPPSP